MKKIGIFIVLIGLGITIFTTISFFTRKKMASNNTAEAEREVPRSLKWSPLTGFCIMGIGGIVFWQTYNEQT